MYRQIGGIDNTVGVAPKISKTRLLNPHPFQYWKMRQKRMRSPRLREPAYQYLLTSLQKYQLHCMTKSLHPLKNTYEIRKKYAFPYIDAERDTFNLASLLMTQFDKGRQQRRR